MADAKTEVSESMLFLLEHAPDAAMKRIAELERDHARIELIDDPGLAPNLRIDADEDGNFCWKMGDDETCYATVRDALDSVFVPDDEDDSDAL